MSRCRTVCRTNGMIKVPPKFLRSIINFQRSAARAAPAPWSSPTLGERRSHNQVSPDTGTLSSFCVKTGGSFKHHGSRATGRPTPRRETCRHRPPLAAPMKWMCCGHVYRAPFRRRSGRCAREARPRRQRADSGGKKRDSNRADVSPGREQIAGQFAFDGGRICLMSILSSTSSIRSRNQGRTKPFPPSSDVVSEIRDAPLHLRKTDLGLADDLWLSVPLRRRSDQPRTLRRTFTSSARVCADTKRVGRSPPCVADRSLAARSPWLLANRLFSPVAFSAVTPTPRAVSLRPVVSPDFTWRAIC